MTAGQSPELSWRGDLPIAEAFDDPYFSIHDGLAETRHVFLAGNGLPERFGPGFRVAELGFGTGLNLCALMAAWRGSGVDGVLHFTTFEAFPMRVEDMERALSAFPEVASETAPVLAALAAGATRMRLPWLDFRMVVGDAREMLPGWDGVADAWFLDGFAPERNPELWEPSLLAEVGAHTAPGGTAATYSAAGAVRRGLADAGFDVERVPGFGRKRHMTVARKG